MSFQHRRGHAWPLGLVSSLMILAGTVAVQAGGGFPTPYTATSHGEATSDAWTTVETEYARYESQTFADVETGAEIAYPNGFTDAWAHASAGNTTNFVVEDGQATYEQDKSAKARVYAKGDNIMAKARSDNKVVITIDGRAYVVVEELARALSRTSVHGTQSLATADTNIAAASSGYLDVNTGTKTEATVRVRE